MNRHCFLVSLLILALAAPSAVFAALDVPELSKPRGDFDGRQGSVAPSAAALDTARPGRHRAVEPLRHHSDVVSGRRLSRRGPPGRPGRGGPRLDPRAP